MTKSKMVAWFAAAFVATSAAPVAAVADACKLIRFASVDMANVGDDPRVFVTATIGDEQRLFLIDSGTPISTIQPDLVEKLHMITKELRGHRPVNSSGKNFRAIATIPALNVGGMQFATVRALVDPDPEGSMYGGSLGADLLLHIDVEFDFAQHKVNFFSQDHCPGRVVYWPHSKMAAVPMHIEPTGYPILSVSLSGHDINALLDTGSTNTLLELNTATHDFGFSPDAANVTKVSGNEAEGMLYQQTFDSLDLSGIKLSNVPVLIHRDMAAEKMAEERDLDSRTGFGMTPQESNGVAPLTVGMQEMHSLHLYLAYKEKTLYVTPNESQASSVTH